LSRQYLSVRPENKRIPLFENLLQNVARFARLIRNSGMPALLIVSTMPVGSADPSETHCARVFHNAGSTTVNIPPSLLVSSDQL
jgi:hypothetical protein